MSNDSQIRSQAVLVFTLLENGTMQLRSMGDGTSDEAEEFADAVAHTVKALWDNIAARLKESEGSDE